MDRNVSSTPLEVYVDFKALPASQAALMLLSLDTLYALLLPENDRPFLYQRYLLDGVGDVPYFVHRDSSHSALCLEQAQTGESITFRFAGRKQKAGINWKGTDAEVILPSWTAAAVGVGALLLGGSEIYDRYLNSELKKAQTEGQVTLNRLTEAQIEKTRAETKEIISRINRDKPKSASQGARRRQQVIERQIASFHNVVNSSNIVTVEINGIPLEKYGGHEALTIDR